MMNSATCALVKMLLKVRGSFGVSIAAAEFSTSQLLEVGRLRVDEHFIECRYRQSFDQTQIDTKSNFAQIVHGLFAGYLFGRL